MSNGTKRSSERERNNRRRDDRDRGREAQKPSDIPSRGWKDIALRVKSEMTKDNLSIVAAGVAFYAFLAIFPALAAFVSLYGLLVSPQELQEHAKIAESLLPPQSANLIQTQLQQIATSQPTQLGWRLLISVALALWSAAKGMKAMMQAMNITYDEEERRGTIKLNLVAILLTLGAIVLVGVFLGLIALLPALWGLLGLNETIQGLLNYLRWPLLAIAAIFGLAVLYRYGPSRERPHWRWVSWGAVVATVLWLAGSALFSLYVSNFGSYDKTYGSLGVVVVLMTWFLLSAYSILLGSEINAEMERQTEKDTTSGQERPRGRRGAYVADTVGERADA